MMGPLVAGGGAMVWGGGAGKRARLLRNFAGALGGDQGEKIHNPAATRPWQHVLEPLSGYLDLAKRLYVDGPRFTGGWNFGPWDHDTKPVESIVGEVTRLWGEGARWEKDALDHPREGGYLKLDSS